MRSLRYVLPIVILLFLIPHPIKSQENSFDVLVIHSGNDELPVLTDILSEYSFINVRSLFISDLQSADISQYKFVVFASNVEFDTDSTAESKLSALIATSGTSMVTFSPFIEEFGDILTTMIGILNPVEILPKEDEETATWNLNTASQIGNLTSGTSFDYSGSILKFEATPSAQALIEVVSGVILGDDPEEVEYPFPVVVNASTPNNQIITSTMGLDSQTLHMFGVLDLFQQLLEQIFAVAVSSYVSLNSIPVTLQTSNDSPSSSLGVSLPGFDSVQTILLLVAALIILLLGKILGVFRRLGEKFIGVGIFVIGIFYNVQDRILDDNDVLMNQQRADIMRYLDFVGGSGAHLRELKSVLNSGTGSLLWHLQVLEDFNWISKVSVDKYSVFVSYDFINQFDTRIKHIELQIQSKITIQVLEILLQAPLLVYDINQLQDKTGIYRKAIRRFITKLNDLELIEIVNDNPIAFRLIDVPTIQKILKNLAYRVDFSFDNKNEVSITRDQT